MLSGQSDTKRLVLFFISHHRKPHRAHQTHLVHLLARMDLHSVPARFPSALWRGEFQVSGFILKRDVHGILPDHVVRVEAWDRFGETATKHLKSLVVLVQAEHDEDAGNIGAKLLRRFDRDDFVSSLESELFVESFRHRDGPEHSLGGRVKIVGAPLLLLILEFRDGGVLRERELFGQRFRESNSAP